MSQTATKPDFYEAMRKQSLDAAQRMAAIARDEAAWEKKLREREAPGAYDRSLQALMKDKYRAWERARAEFIAAKVLMIAWDSGMSQKQRETNVDELLNECERLRSHRGDIASVEENLSESAKSYFTEANRALYVIDGRNRKFAPRLDKGKPLAAMSRRSWLRGAFGTALAAGIATHLVTTRGRHEEEYTTHSQGNIDLAGAGVGGGGYILWEGAAHAPMTKETFTRVAGCIGEAYETVEKLGFARDHAQVKTLLDGCVDTLGALDERLGSERLLTRDPAAGKQWQEFSRATGLAFADYMRAEHYDRDYNVISRDAVLLDEALLAISPAMLGKVKAGLAAAPDTQARETLRQLEGFETQVAALRAAAVKLGERTGKLAAEGYRPQLRANAPQPAR